MSGTRVIRLGECREHRGTRIEGDHGGQKLPRTHRTGRYYSMKIGRWWRRSNNHKFCAKKSASRLRQPLIGPDSGNHRNSASVLGSRNWLTEVEPV